MLGIMVKEQHRQFNRAKKKRKEKKKEKLKLLIKKKNPAGAFLVSKVRRGDSGMLLFVSPP